MNNGCLNPVWPCAMAGAAACLSGFSDLGVVLHGSSGCYYYTETLVNAPIYCTFLTQNEIIFGTEERLREVVKDISGLYSRIAVLSMCVPAVTGEDIRDYLRDYDVLVVDAPGFAGTLEEGYRKALQTLGPSVDETRPGVNIDGICPVDRFATGNLAEAKRLLHMSGISPATTFCRDTLQSAYNSAPVTITTNPDYASGVGNDAGSLLGIRAIRETFSGLDRHFAGADTGQVLEEIDMTEERIIQACDRHLRRYDPPRAAIFGTASYANAVAEMLETYLDAEILALGTRNEVGSSAFPCVHTIDLGTIRDLIDANHPDLVIGSSYERALAPDAAFVWLTHPLRESVMLHNRPLAGTEGALCLMESVLNACIDEQKNRNTAF